MNVWADWIAPAVLLLSVVLVWAGVAVARRQRVAAEAARDVARQERLGAAAMAVEALQSAHHAVTARDAVDRSMAELERSSATVVHLPGPVRHQPSQPGEIPDTCLAGDHDWSRRDVSNVRHPPMEPSKFLCSVTWRCGCCPAIRHEQNVPPPLSLAVASGTPTPTVGARVGLDGGDADQPTIGGPAGMEAS